MLLNRILYKEIFTMLQKIKNFSIITISVVIMAIGVYYFKFPNNFS